jgi:hypothetical protein
VNRQSSVWFPYAIPFYVARIAEMRPVLIVLAAVITIGILVWKKPRHWTLWCWNCCWRADFNSPECRRSPSGRAAAPTWLMRFKMNRTTAASYAGDAASGACVGQGI